MSRRASDLIICSILATAAAVSVVLLPEGNLLRIILAVLLALVLPGYSVAAFAFPDTALEMSARIVYSVGGSIAICALGGLLLNLIPGGLILANWLIFLTSMIAIASLGALVRRLLASDNNSVPRTQFHVSFSQMALIGLFIVLIIAGTVSIARSGAIQQPATRFTQLWMEPSAIPIAGTAANRTLNIGVFNDEQQAMHYTLALTDPNGDSIQTYDISLNASQTWQRELVLPAGQGIVSALLYRADNPTVVYRRVTFDLATDGR